MMLKLVIASLMLGCFYAKAMDNSQGTELINICDEKNSVELALTIENIKGQINGADWEICCGRKKKEHKDLAKQLGILRTQLIALENKKHNIDKLDTYELSSPHAVLMYTYKKLNSLHGFQSIEPFILKNITKIDLSHNNLEVFPLPFFIESCPNLQALHAAHNTLIDLVYRSHRSPHGIATSTTLTTLDLSHNNLTKINFAALYTAIPYMESLDLSSNKELFAYEYPPDVLWHQKNPETWPSLNVRDTLFRKEQLAGLRALYKDNVIEVMKSRLPLMGEICASGVAIGIFGVGMLAPGTSIGLAFSLAGIASAWGLLLGDDIKKRYMIPNLIAKHSAEAIALSEKNVLCDEKIDIKIEE